MRRIERVEFETFEWDEAKRLRVLDERDIDFRDAANALLGPHLRRRSDQNEEIRFLSVVRIETEIVAVIYTLRDPNCRIVTARATRDDERREYREVFG
jgi:uncharacterized DUF497 family protein